jgi:very-short-patch-repair endonuclease
MGEQTTNNLIILQEQPTIGNNIQLCYATASVKRTFASSDKAQYWSKRNKDKPSDFGMYSNKKRWFKCDKCPHDFESSLSHVSEGNWCPYCSGRKLCEKPDCNDCFKRSFASHDKAKYWSDRNEEVKPSDCAISSGIKRWFDCDKCHHDFESSLSNVLKGSWCPYCSGHKLCENPDCNDCFKRSFASHEKAPFWSVKNKEVKTMDCAISSHKKLWFDCDKCHHDFESSLSNVLKGRWCPYCSGQKLCENPDCNDCFKRSFASHEKAPFWSVKNKVKPRDCGISSGIKRWFDCDKCSHEFESVLYSVSNGHWCPHCVNKTETKLFETMLEVYPNIKRQFKATWCKGQTSKRFLPFDFCIPDLEIIIELDGRQHFIQVSNWQSPDETRANDLYKEECATKNRYNVIRIIQEDVWNDSYDWETKLTNAIDSIKLDTETIYVTCLCENDEYDTYIG